MLPTLARRPLFYGLCLLAGALLASAAGLMHPFLTGDGAAQLETISATKYWYAIHWALLFAFPLMYMGLIGVALRHGETPGSAPGRAGVLLAGFAFAVWSLNVLFMVGAGAHLAHAYTTSDKALTSTHAVFLYDMLHPAGLAAERLATFALGLVAYVYGWAIWNGKVYPRWLGWWAFAVAVTNAAVAVGFSEFSQNLYYGQAFFVAWLVATAAVMLLERRPA
jgi:hypothetical protein